MRGGDWTNAARVLAIIPLQTGQRQYSVDCDLELSLKTARLGLQGDDPVQAEASVNPAPLLQNESTTKQLQRHDRCARHVFLILERDSLKLRKGTVSSLTRQQGTKAEDQRL